jgi:hypothetical protein
MGDELVRVLREEFWDARSSVRFMFCADATAPRARARSFLSCMMSFSRLEAVTVGSGWWCEGKIRNRKGETGWPALYEGRLDKARMDGLDILPAPRNPQLHSSS